MKSARLDRANTVIRGLLNESASIVDPSRIVVTSKLTEETWPLDELKIQQVLINVLDNAVLASDEGQVELDASIEKGRLIIRIRDHGPGIDSGREEQIFEPFHTGRATGTGLGLAIARRVVSLHGGTIQASNHPEGGALFTLDIPSDDA
ncbi:MAG: ATP-binding protein [Polyangiaceae bacterium]